MSDSFCQKRQALIFALVSASVAFYDSERMSSEAEIDLIFTLRELTAHLQANEQIIYWEMYAGSSPGFRLGIARNFWENVVDTWSLAGLGPSNMDGNHG